MARTHTIHIKMDIKATLKLKGDVAKLRHKANQRLDRLEKSGLTSSPAYKSWEENGAIRFGVKGKDYNQLQSEYWRLMRFLDAKTSTVRGARAVLKEIAVNTGMPRKDIGNLQAKANSYFRLADRISEYLVSIGQTAQALNYRLIWESINTMIAQDKIALDGTKDFEREVEGRIKAWNEMKVDSRILRSKGVEVKTEVDL